jgi:acyl carrier protein
VSADSRLRKVLADVLGVDPSKLTDNDSPTTIPTWDSVGHIQLMLAIEAEFGVTFSPDLLATLTSVGAIRRHLDGVTSDA